MTDPAPGFTPSTDQVRAEYVTNRAIRVPTTTPVASEFDRWLTQERAAVLRDAADALATRDFLLPCEHAPMPILVDWLRIRADELEQEDKR